MRPVKYAGGVGALIFLLACAPASTASSDPYCTGSYGGAAAASPAKIRFGIDPGLAGSAGPEQLPAPPDNARRDLAALHALRPAHRLLVLRLNRLFWSEGNAG